MSSTLPVYRHQGNTLFAITMFILVFIAVFIFIAVTEVAFEKIGFSRTAFLIILGLTFIGSFVNIPITKVKGVENVVQYREVSYFWVSYRIPQFFRRQVSTVISINVGGALVPVIVSIYLLATHVFLIGYALIGVAFSTIVVKLVARKVRGVGIVTPAFVPPLAAALISILIFHGPEVAIIAYVSGTLGALIGADLLNLRGITKLGAPLVSIGGAGTFDGVFLTGIVAVLLVWLVSLV
jgi:uncharacterized membrane protein